VEFSAKPKTRHKALVVGMYVLPAFRGRGLARALMQAAVACCDARGGVRVVQLEVTQGNEPATALYGSLGFEAWGVEPLAVITPGGPRAKLHLWLQLPHPPEAPDAPGRPGHP
jgi:L-amino acid N-acyltransferase YncA